MEGRRDRREEAEECLCINKYEEEEEEENRKRKIMEKRRGLTAVTVVPYSCFF